MADVASLQIRIDSIEADLASRRLDNVSRSGGMAERATDGLTRSFSRLLGPLAASVSSMAALNKIVSVAREFDVLNAQLVTATGSADNAKKAFEGIQTFASETPYDLAQVTDAFVKLTNLGLTPSESALTSYGNTASAMGKSLNQMIEAVADATTGEFERLKEFGIKSKSEGDNVSFTFRGVTTTVGKNAAEIEGYLKALGENEFAGAMAQRMDTLDGAISNLGDEWDKLFLNVSNQGVGSVIEDSVRLAIDILAELNAQLASGQMQMNLLNIRQSFSDWGTDVENLANIAETFLNNLNVQSATSSIQIDKSFGHIPANIRSFIQLMTVELAAFVDKTSAYGSEIADSLKFWDGDQFNLEDKLKSIDQARMDSIDTILAENSAATTRYDNEKSKIEAVRLEYDKLQAAKASSTVDSLASFGIDKPASTGETSDDAKKREAGERELERLRQQLLTEEEAIQESYLRRLDIIVNNTEQGSAIQNELVIRAAKERNEAMAEIEKAAADSREQTASNVISTLMGLEKSGSKEGMQIAKTAAIAQATMKTYESAQSAYASLAGIPYVGPALGAAAAAAAVAAGMQNVSQIKSAGAFESGGIVGGNSYSGDSMVANVNSGEMILNRQQQANLFNQANGGGGQSNIQIVNLLDINALAESISKTQEFEQSVLNVISVNKGEV